MADEERDPPSRPSRTSTGRHRALSEEDWDTGKRPRGSTLQDRVAYIEYEIRQHQRQIDSNSHGTGELNRRLEHQESEMRTLKATDASTDEKLRVALEGLIKERDAEKNFFRGIKWTIAASVGVASAVAGVTTFLVSHFVK